MKLSIVIPSFNDSVGLWYTVAAARAELEHDFRSDEYEIIAVIDGPEDPDGNRVVLGMRQQNMCRIINTETRTPQRNRHIGLMESRAPYVFFLDSHVVPCRDFFRRMLRTARETRAAVVHSGHCFWSRSAIAYAYNMNWNDYFWSMSAESKPKFDNRPYYIAVSGHGAVCVDKEQYLAVGGYWDALTGWGGEEPQLNLKVWMMGRKVVMEPRVYHWHFMPHKRHMENVQLSPYFVKNFMLIAYAAGGDKYLTAVHTFFTLMCNRSDSIEEAVKKPPVSPFDDLLAAVPREAAVERALICSGPFGGDLDALRRRFEAKMIPH